MVLTPPPEHAHTRRRSRRDPQPHFKQDLRGQLDAVRGCPELQVPEGHWVRQLWRLLEQQDFSAAEREYSSLGRHGYAPRSVVGVLVYGSLVGLHESTKLAHALTTDAALRFLSGGHAISAPTLRRFRRTHLTLFQSLNQQVLQRAEAEGWLRRDELAVDSVRIEAQGSKRATGRRTHSETRVAQLREAVANTPPGPEHERATRQLARHEKILAACAAQDSATVVLTNPLAGLIHFPNGGSGPGHRVTVVGSGRRERLIVGLLVDGRPNDHHTVQESLELIQRELAAAGLPAEALRIRYDAGYWDDESVQYAARLPDTVQVLLAEQAAPTAPGLKGCFGRAEFVLSEDGRTVTCPAGKPMCHRKAKGGGRYEWEGDGCASCGLRSRCCGAGRTRRLYNASPAYERARVKLREELQSPVGQASYAGRKAIIEPIFAALQRNMGYRRATTRHDEGIWAELTLKALAYNFSRVLRVRERGSLSVVYICLG